MPETIVLSPLSKTWILDLDGTIVKHNGYKTDGHDTLLPGAKEFLSNICPEDMVIIITSRTDDYYKQTVDFLADNGIRYDHIVFNAPYGERVIVNDRKPSGLKMAVAINSFRDVAPNILLKIDELI